MSKRAAERKREKEREGLRQREMKCCMLDFNCRVTPVDRKQHLTQFARGREKEREGEREWVSERKREREREAEKLRKVTSQLFTLTSMWTGVRITDDSILKNYNNDLRTFRVSNVSTWMNNDESLLNFFFFLFLGCNNFYVFQLFLLLVHSSQC